MRILLTGPGGFLGRALTRYWAKAGHTLWLLARPTTQLHYLDGLLPAVRVLRAADPEEVAAAVCEAAPEAIVHTAGSYGRKDETPLDLIKNNLTLGITLIQAALNGLVRSEGPVSFLNTGTGLDPCVSLYALSKTQFSTWGSALAMQAPERLRFINIRLQHMYGQDHDRSKFTTNVFEACLRNEERLLLTPGEQLRDFIHVDDVVRAYDKILERRNGFACTDTIDVGSGEAITIRRFVEMVKEISGASTELDFGALPYRANEAMLCVADTSLLYNIGWRLEKKIADGIDELISAQCRENTIEANYKFLKKDN
jgi:CDP-paratose synthetase